MEKTLPEGAEGVIRFLRRTCLQRRDGRTCWRSPSGRASSRGSRRLCQVARSGGALVVPEGRTARRRSRPLRYKDTVVPVLRDAGTQEAWSPCRRRGQRVSHELRHRPRLRQAGAGDDLHGGDRLPITRIGIRSPADAGLARTTGRRGVLPAARGGASKSVIRADRQGAAVAYSRYTRTSSPPPTCSARSRSRWGPPEGGVRTISGYYPGG